LKDAEADAVLLAVDWSPTMPIRARIRRQTATSLHCSTLAPLKRRWIARMEAEQLIEHIRDAFCRARHSQAGGRRAPPAL